MGTSCWRVAVRKDRDEVERLVGVDRADLERSPFQRAQWLETWFGAFGDEARAEVFAASIEDAATGAPVFVLPLVARTRHGLRCLEAWDGGVSDYNAPVLSRAFAPSRDDMKRLWSELLRALPPADLLELGKLPPAVGDRANPLLAVAGVHPSRFCRHVLPIPAGADFEGLKQARFDPSHCRSLAKKRRKLENKGRLEFAFLSGEAALPTLDLILDWRGARFADETRAGEMRRAEAFYRSLCGTTDLARVGRLTLDGRPIAGCFGTLTDRSFQLLAVAHDPAFKNWSPGLLAIESAIAEVCAEGGKVFDFTIGDEPYKHDFGVEVEGLWEIERGLSVKGCLFLLLRDTARRVLARWRSWRHTAATSVGAPTLEHA